MTIKQNGGIFGRNPTFNDVDVEGNLTTSGTITVVADSISGDAINGGTATPTTVTSTTGNFTTLNNGGTVPSDLHGTWSHSFFGGKGSIISENNPAGGIPGLYLTDNAYLDVDTGSFSYLTTDEASAIRLTGGEIQFRSAASGTAGTTVALTEKAKFTTAGNLAFASGLGIDFSATSDGSGSASSELFSDYEHGTWTPVFASSTDAADNVTNSKVGYYIKVGRQVYIFADLIGNDLSGITGTDQVTVEGLPYALQGTSNGNDHAVSFASFRYLLTTNHTGSIQNQSGAIKFTTDGFSAATYATLFQFPSNTGTFIRLSVTYFSAS